MSDLSCPSCPSEEMKEDRRNHKLSLGDIDYVIVLNAAYQYCGDCGEETLALPKMESLFDLVAKLITENGNPLSGAEVKFFRKHFVGKGILDEHRSEEDFSRLLGIGLNTLRSVERGDRMLRPSEQILLRLYANPKPPKAFMRRMLMGLSRRSLLKVQYNEESGEWEKAPTVSPKVKKEIEEAVCGR